MLEVLGDSARGEGSQSCGLRSTKTCRRGRRARDSPPLAGLTLLEAAAVPGETLAADAVANALAQVFRADPDSDGSRS
jgi:hypothetical protein